MLVVVSRKGLLLSTRVKIVDKPSWPVHGTIRLSFIYFQTVFGAMESSPSSFLLFRIG